VISSKFFSVIMIGVLFALPVQAGLFGPKNYDECITESMKGVTSDLAARAIIKSCRERFPEKKKQLPPSKSLSIDQLMNFTGRAGLSFGNYYSGNLYNGNSDVTITEIKVYVTTKMNERKISVYICVKCTLHR
jgi:hypothetical protein